MGKIPQHFIDDLMTRIDIVDVVGRRVALKKAGREFKACCPFHDEKTPSFHVVPNKQFYHCFGCGAHGTALGFLMEYEQLSFVEAVEDLAAQLSLEVPREQGSAPNKTMLDLYPILNQASEYFQHQLRQSENAINYLKQRNLSGEIAKRFALGFAPKGWDSLLTHLSTTPNKDLEKAGLVIRRDDGSGCYDRFRNRIMFPIRDHRGRTIAFGGRVIENENPKYLNSPETSVFHKGRELYGLYEARQARYDLQSIVMVEGYMDVIALHQQGIGNVVATLGTATTRDHLTKLFRTASEVVFCFDGDNAGSKAAWRALQTCLPEIRDGRQMRFLFLPEGEDPDSLVNREGEQRFRQRIEHATPLSEFLIQHLSAELDLSHVDGRATFAESAKPFIQKIPTGIYRDMLVTEVAKAAGLSVDTLLSHIPSLPQVKTAQAKSNVKRRSISFSEKSHGQNSLVRKAISLLVHFPSIAGNIKWPGRLEEIGLPGIPLLIELLEELSESEPVNTGVLLERWRDHPNGRHLARLAAQECLVNNAESAQAELNDALNRLAYQAGRELRLSELLAKSRREPLSSSEKQELKELLTAQS